MKKIYLICFLVFACININAQTIATTADGRKVILFDNGRWRNFQTDNTIERSTNVVALYNEAYNYAYDILYAEEFFANERKNKSNGWAKEYIAKNLYIPIGSQTLENWFKNLYEFAYENLFKNEFFSPDRKKYSREWAEQTVREKAYFEDFRLSVISKHRTAYNVAYNHIYAHELFDADRKKKALQWANDFINK